MTHSYYATMGGFAFSNESPLGDWVTLDGWKRLTLTSLGIFELVKHKPELLPDLSVADIQDKSKASGLAKTIVIMQASWFMVQCLSRMGTGMTISVLELNTFAHALCALVAYAMWWRKPLDISQPTLIKGPGTDQVCGSLYRRSLTWWGSTHVGVRAKAFHESGDKLYAKMMIQNPGLPERPITSGYEWTVQSSSKDGEPLRVVASAPSGFYKPLDCLGPSGQKSSNVMLPPGIVSPSDDGAIFRLYYGQTVFGIGISSGGAFHSNMLHNVWLGRGMKRTVGVFVELSPAEVLLYQLGSERVMPGPGCDLPVIHRIKNSLTDGTCAINNATTMTVGLFIAGTIYGGLHLVAWSPPVRSNAETTIWRFSASFIIIFGCGYWLIGMLRTRWIEFRSKKLRGNSSLLKWLGDLDAVLHFEWIHNVAVLAVIMIYILARIYLVVECFVGVPRLPDSVFETPAWAQYFPHFG
ncbi:hypothetical protein QBC42DRAFT_274255 [Cladorrhinum samala]|uniref:Uncharacterized protein n=1 Tax=Cladorrhinum samala TaxID=585594 RepID=A0AAV9HKH1_9PEZI|nr:hypothetical protein QBC42DRAFT_274255 [Cladorrhinum samala]